jgi:hypothetical protein
MSQAAVPSPSTGLRRSCWTVGLLWLGCATACQPLSNHWTRQPGNWDAPIPLAERLPTASGAGTLIGRSLTPPAESNSAAIRLISATPAGGREPPAVSRSAGLEPSLAPPLASRLRVASSDQVASRDGAWRPDMAVMPQCSIVDQQVHIRNVRNCRYRSEQDYDVAYYDLQFQLSDLQGVDYIVVPFQQAPMLAHTMLSFRLRDGRRFVISVEARLRTDQSYSLIAGMRNQMQLMYVIGDERDLIRLRTEVRQVDVYIYPAEISGEGMQNLLVDMLQRANTLAQRGEYYHTLNNNCTTNLVWHINRLRPGTIPEGDWRVMLPGLSDSLALQLGLLQIDYSLPEARRSAHVNLRARLYSEDPAFSERIRGG